MHERPTVHTTVTLQHCVNFRDLGGLTTRGGQRVRDGLIFRSNAPDHLSEADVHTLVRDLGLKTMVDLRSTPEFECDGGGPLVSAGVSLRHVPLYDGPTRTSSKVASIPLATKYLLLLQIAKEPIRQVFETIANTQQPLLFYCAAGKDRTGIIAALLLKLLDVRDADIIRDYTATAEHLPQILAHWQASPSYAPMAELAKGSLHARPETMSTFVEHLEGNLKGSEGYLLSAGLKAKAIQSIRDRLLS